MKNWNLLTLIINGTEASVYIEIYPTLYTIPKTGQIWLEVDNKFD